MCLPSCPAPGNCDGLEVATVVMTRENKTGRVKAPITVSSVQVYLLDIILTGSIIILTWRLHSGYYWSLLYCTLITPGWLLSLAESLHNWCPVVASRRSARYRRHFTHSDTGTDYHGHRPGMTCLSLSFSSLSPGYQISVKYQHQYFNTYPSFYDLRKEYFFFIIII